MIIKLKDFILRIIHVLILIYLLSFVPVFWNWHPLVVISGSMEKTLNVGGLLYYQPIEIEDYKKGDILVYKVPNHIISHRIVEIKDDGFITKGDANNTSDNKIITKDQILGIGTNWCIPYLGFYVDFIYHHKYLLFISIAVIFIDLANDLYKEKQKKVDKNEIKN